MKREAQVSGGVERRPSRVALMGKQKRSEDRADDELSRLCFTLPLYIAIASPSVRTRVHHVICLESACLVCYSLFMWSTSSVGNEKMLGERDERGAGHGAELGGNDVQGRVTRRRFSVDERDVTVQHLVTR